MAQTIEQLIEFIATTETPKSVTNPIVAEALSLLLGKTYRLFDGDKVNNIVQEGGFSDVFVVNGQTVDPRPGDLLYNAEGTYGRWGVITDVHLEGQQLYVTYVWEGCVNTIMIDENGDAARYVNRYKTPKVYDAQSVLSASSAGNMQDYFLIKDPDNPTQSFFEFWQVGDLIGSPKGGIIVSDILNPGGLDNTMMYIYGGEIVTITYKAQSPAKIMSVSKAKIGSPEEAANFNGSLYSRINAINSQFIVLDLPYAASLSEELLKIPTAIRRKGMRLKYKQVPYNKYIEGVYIDEDVSDDKWKGSGWVFNHVCGNVGGEPSIGICTRSASANDMESISVGYGAISYDQNSASFGNNVTARGQSSFAQGTGSFGTYFDDSVTFPTNDSIDFGDFDLQDLKVGDFVQMGIDDIGMALPVVRKIKSISGNIVTFTEEIPKEIRDYGEVYIDINKGSIGRCSFTANDDTNALNLAETAFGRWNKSVGEEGSDTLWKGNSTCTLFSIGNGTSHSNRRNALEVKQDGTILVQKPGTSNTFNLQGTIGNPTDAAKEDGSLYARIADVNNRINASIYSPFYALITETVGNNTVSVSPYYFGETPIIMSGQKGCTMPVNRYQRALLGVSRSYSLKYSDIANFDDFVGWITVGYKLVFLYRKNGEDVINETIQTINSGSDNFNSARDVVYILDFFRNKAIIQGIDRTQNKIVTYDNRDISNVDKTLFESAYLYSATQMYTGFVAQNYLLANAYFSASEYLNKYPVIGMFSDGVDFVYREQHKRVKSTSVTIFNDSSGGSVDYELQEGRHIIANVNVTGTGNNFCSPRVHTNIDSESVTDLYIIIRFKILSGSCSIKNGTSDSFYVIDDNYNFAEKDSLTCEVGREYLVQASYRRLIEVSYANKYYFKMFGNFKIEVIDAFVSIPHSQINCAERFKNVYTGNIPFIPANKNIAIEFPLIQYEGTDPIVIGKMKATTTGNVYITVEQNKSLVYKKITQ